MTFLRIANTMQLHGSVERAISSENAAKSHAIYAVSNKAVGWPIGWQACLVAKWAGLLLYRRNHVPCT